MAIAAVVIGVYLTTANSGRLELLGSGASDSYYNLLVEGLRDGHLHLKREAPPGFTRLADPYNPEASSQYRYQAGSPLHDLSYYRGKLYLYFGVSPAMVLFWPYTAATGRYLLHRDAAVIFFSAGFLAGAGLLWAAWRRYFGEVRFWVVIAGTLAIGLANFTPVILQRTDVYEVAISCGYAFTMLALAGIWGALHQPARRGRWLAFASFAYGLALGARPSLLFGAVILLVPVIQAAREKQGVWRLLPAALGPVVLIGFGLLSYNALRFGDPLEFGQRYQTPSPIAMGAREQFSPHYLGFNFRVAFLAPAHWIAHFPFVREITTPSVPKGYWEVQNTFGVLANIPLVWLALAAPLAWRGRSAETASTLRWFAAAVVLLFATCALILGLHNSMVLRYEVEFTHTLVLLAVIGIFGLERTLAGGPVLWRRTARFGWVLLLLFSIGFNLLASAAQHPEYEVDLASALMKKGNYDDAIVWFKKTLAVRPDHKQANLDLANVLHQTGRIDEAIHYYQNCLALQPDYLEAHINLGIAWQAKGSLAEAIACFQKALAIQPTSAEAHYNLGCVLSQSGQMDAAMVHYESALKTRSDHASAHFNLGTLLLQRGDTAAAIGHLREVVELEPAKDDGYRVLTAAYAQAGRFPEAIATVRKGIALATAQHNTTLASDLEQLLAQCEAAALSPEPH